MHILVIGGTGPSGLAFVKEALDAGHKLTLYARSPHKFPQEVHDHSDTIIIKGEFTDMNAVKQALSTGAEALISFAGPTLPAKGLAVSEFYERLCPLLPTESSVKHCMMLSTGSYSVLEDHSSLKWFLGIWAIRLCGGTAYAEINGMSRALAALPSDKVKWTLFRVPRLNNGSATLVRAGYLGDGTDGLFLSRQSLALWVLQELQERKWVGKAPALSNPGLL